MMITCSARQSFLIALAASVAVHAAILTWHGTERAVRPAPPRATVIVATLVSLPPSEPPAIAAPPRQVAPPPSPAAPRAQTSPAQPPLAPRVATPPEPPRQEHAPEPAVTLATAPAPVAAERAAPPGPPAIAPESPAQVAVAPRPRTPEADTAAARYLHNPPPQYPWEARRKGMEGRVVLRVEILASGETGRIDVHQSSGHEVLDQAAVKAVGAWRFVAPRINGATVSGWAEVPISFRLADR